MIEKVKELNEWVADDREPCLEEIEHFACCLNSYFGFLKHHKTYAVKRKISGMIAKGWWRYAYISGHFEKVSVVNRYKASKAVRKKALDMRKGIYYQR